MKEINKGIIAKKIGMTQVFSEKGSIVPVTVLEACENVILQKKSSDKDGYTAVKVGLKEVNADRLSKPMKGQSATLNRFFKKMVELRLKNSETLNLGEALSVVQFSENEKVSASGVMKGRGFTGTVKRYNFTIGPISHGSKHHRRKGTSGAGTGQAKVWKGQKTAGHYGNVLATVKNVLVVKVMAEKNVLLIKGAIPGPTGGLIKIYN